MPTVLSNGCLIHYRLHGSWEMGATPLVLIPGWGCDAGSWGGLLGRLAADRPCIAVDNRGGGGSGRTRRLFGIATMADDAIGVLDALGIKEADVLGNSLGGMVAQAMAVRNPNRVRSLILLSTSPGIGSIPCHPTIVGDGVRCLSRRLRSHGTSGSGAPSGEKQPAAAIGLRPPSATTGPRPSVSLFQLGATLSWFGLPVLSRIRVPTLVIHGTHDAVIPALNARLVARLIRGAELRLIPGAGHLILDTSAEAVAAAVASLLEREGGSSPAAGAASQARAATPQARAATPQARGAAPQARRATPRARRAASPASMAQPPTTVPAVS